MSHNIKSGKLKIAALNNKVTKDNPLSKYLQKPRWSKKELKEKYEKIISQNNSNINLHPFKEDSPLVSIIILNRNGKNHLSRLFSNFKENIHYPNYEIIVVDQDSGDGSVAFLENLSPPLPLKIIKNKENKSFSQAHNQVVDQAQGEYLLLLNNDVEPLKGWLNQMMHTALENKEVGAVGAQLIYPFMVESSINSQNSFKIQHAGIAFKDEKGFIKPYNRGNGSEPFSMEKEDKVVAAVTAAALLVEKEKYLEAGGLDEGYEYGYEDVDFCLKLLKKGYTNIYTPRATLFHYEFGTQEKNKSRDVRRRRLSNRKLFRRKWNPWLKKELFKDKLLGRRILSEQPLKVALVVTESGEDASAGDYFTALELGEGLKKIGWQVSFLPRRGPGNWYDVGDADILLSLLDSYDPRKVKASGSLIKIAWPRNWFDRWVSSPGFSSYHMVLSPSPTSCNYIKEKSGKDALLFPIAANTERFHENITPQEEYACDYCFTGSYWNDPREIMEMLEPDKLPYHFKIYGKNWEKVEKFKDYHQGFINYSQVPQIYASTKLVINDANRVTKGFGATNSRVYDALACGVLVISNGLVGSRENFQGKVPVFQSKEELNELIKYYLDNEKARQDKARELQKFVLKHHTYDVRARTLKKILEDYFYTARMAIKIPAPSWEEVEEWGDYHVARALKKELEKKGCEVTLQVLPEWEEDKNFDVVLVLRGLSRYHPQEKHFNIMWNISHPDKVSVEEYSEYDHVFIASSYWASRISKLVDVPVEVMLQCTDHELFYPDYDEKYAHDLLFVGNSRKVFRKILKDLLPSSYDLAVYGKGWEEFIDKEYIKGEHIPNNELRKAYSSCKILLNDHWDDMREKGFLSNRLFDGVACGAFIISDKVKGGEDVFGDRVVFYEGEEDLKNKIDEILNNRSIKSPYQKKSMEDHNFKNLANHIIKNLIN
ncbi:glycosyltransferase [Methanobacterium alkalithermotolerans]|uniref:Glycosyltransferase n=1 Tax=Methanobacterium alkalithermotolerans TaxID=2731220 RepID=A0A8T8K599_9EURY|nr:glycosyltransferase [Methanobacterium alkalithermotolerans]QUH23768.1 glycosyltransferase [Methanobacterium alkalithermotolerans]